jgi:hypothetical protein
MKNEELESKCTDIAREIKGYFHDYEISFYIKERQGVVNFFIHRRIGNQYCMTETISDILYRDGLVGNMTAQILRWNEQENMIANMAESEYFYIDTDNVQSLFPKSVLLGVRGNGKRLKELINKNYGWSGGKIYTEEEFISNIPKSYNFIEAVHMMVSGKKMVETNYKGYFYFEKNMLKSSIDGFIIWNAHLDMVISNQWHEYTELAPCPICNTNENVILKTDNSGSYIHYECECCGCRKQSFKLSEEVQALTDWNKRDWKKTK